MSTDTLDKVGIEQYEPLRGQVVLLSNSAVEQTGLLAGKTYEFIAVGGTALCRWDTTAAAASDLGFTFAVTPGHVVRVKCPIGNTLLNIIEADIGSTATAVLLLSEVAPF